MNRREAIAALTALPATTRISRTVVQPKDVIVVEIAGHADDRSIERIRETLLSVWPNQKIVVLCHGTTLKIVEEAQ